MTEAVSINAVEPTSAASKILKTSATLWFLTAVAGQFIFAYYILVFYGSNALQGNWDAWTKRLINGIIEGDLIGNAAVILHIVLAFVITVSGPLQLIPQIRNRFPTFHHWNGRVYILTAFVISLGALYMTWTRGIIGDLSQHISISLNAVLIMLFAAIALRYAMARQIAIHRRWALRLFLVVSGVWFFRVGFMLWMLIHQKPVGFDPETFTGPFLTFIAFGQYLLPLAILELYFRAQDRASAQGQLAMAATLVVLTILMSVGIFGAVVGMWLPLL